MLRSMAAHVHRLMMVVAIMVLGVWVMDHLTTYEEVKPSGSAHAAARERGRLFVLLVDSLRYQTAIDPQQMPYLSAMRARGVHAKLLSSRDAVTVSAIREMFTGRERFLAFGFVRDFVTGRESVESLFTQAKHAGIATSVYPPYAFVQFAGDFPAEPVDEGVADRDQAQQDRWVRQALARFSSGEKDFVVSHIVYSDRVAHDYGIHGEVYRQTFRDVDALIAEIDAHLPASDGFVVTGDHGHTDNGRHSLGLDVPSFMVYRGAAFRRGVSLGTVPITAHRYLMSWALGLPLVEDYASSRHPEALAGPATGDFATAVSPAEARRRSGQPQHPWAFVLLALDAGLLAGLWLSSLWQPARRALDVAYWLALAALGLCVFDLRALWLPPLFVGLWMWRSWGSRDVHVSMRWSAMGAALGVLIHGWGRFLSLYRDAVHEPSYEELRRVSLSVIVLTALASWRVGAVRASWVAVALLGVLGYPTVYRYGAMPALVTLWLAWLAATLVDRMRDKASLWMLLALPVFLLIQPFAFSDAGNFEHHSWIPWLDALVPDGHEQWVLASLAAKAVVFVRWSVPHRCKPLGVFAVWQLHLVHWTRWYPSDVQYVVMIAALAAAGAALPRWLDEEAGRETRRVCWLWALYLAYYYTIRIPSDHYMWCDCLLAALVLSAAIARKLATKEALRGHEAILSVLALVVAGWVTVAWTLHLYEWKVLYAWFDAAMIEEHALWFIPFINGRYLLPVVMARLLLREAFFDRQAYPRREVWSALGIKLASLTCLLSGIGFSLSDSQIYLEAIGEAAALMVFSVGFL